MRIPSVFTVYRDAGAIGSTSEPIREAAYTVGRSLIEQAACYGSDFVGASFYTLGHEDAPLDEPFPPGYAHGIAIWKRWMRDARRLGVPRLAIEMAAGHREAVSTIEATRTTLDELAQEHAAHPHETVPVGLCYDVGHGMSTEETSVDDDRDFMAWFRAFPKETYEVHLKDSDPEFLSTRHWDPAGGDRFIDPVQVIRGVRDTLTAETVYLHVEVPGKRGRWLGEKRAITEHRGSFQVIADALAVNGFDRGDDGIWYYSDNEANR